MTKRSIEGNRRKKIKKRLVNGEYRKALTLAILEDEIFLGEVGDLFFKKNKYEISEKIFNKIIELNPLNYSAWVGKAIAIANLSRHREAIKCCERAIALNPQAKEAWHNKGASHSILEENREAIGCFDRAIELDSNLAIAWYDKGIILFRSKNNAEAIGCFDRAVVLNPDLAVAWYCKGTVFSLLEKYEEAIECFDKAVALNPDYPEAWANKGVALHHLFENVAAIECLDKAMMLNVDNVEILRTKGLALSHLEKYEEAIECFDKAVALNPDYPEAWANKGVALSHLEKHREVIGCFDKVIKLTPDSAEAWACKGVALHHLYENVEAIVCLNKAIELNADYAAAWATKGGALICLENYAEGIECLDKAIELDPELAVAWANKGIVLFRLEKYEEAIVCFNKAIKLNLNPDIWVKKGLALCHLQKHREAIGCFDKAIELDPELAGAWNNKGAAYSHLEEYGEAIRCFDKSIELDPKAIDAWHNKGIILTHLKNNTEAIECFSKVIELNPNFAMAWDGKGTAYSHLGEYGEAIGCFDKAIELNPNFYYAYVNLAISLLNLHEFDKAIVAFGNIKNLFPEIASNENIEEIELLALNASALMKRLNYLDEQFKTCFSIKNFSVLEEKSLKISKEAKSIFEYYEHTIIPYEVKELLNAKNIFFNYFYLILSNLWNNENTELKDKLKYAKDIFIKWQLDEFIVAINSLENLFYALKKSSDYDNITKCNAEDILELLKPFDVLNAVIRGKISEKIKGEVFLQEVIPIEYQPKIIYRNFGSTEKEWVRFCLVQIQFSLEATRPNFGYKLTDTNTIKKKVLQTLAIAKINNVDIICFPELSFSKEWINEIRSMYNKMIIIGGSYYDEASNICSIIIDGEYITPPYRKHRPSAFEVPIIANRGMKPGEILYIFQTRCGNFAVLSCSDYADQSYRIIKSGNNLDFIINPCCDFNIKRFQQRCNSDCSDYGIDVIQVNKASEGDKYGKTCLIGKEHNIFLDRLREEHLKPNDDINYKLFQLDEEKMIIFDLNIKIKAPPINLTTTYQGRVKINELYEYQNDWVPTLNL